MKIYIAGKVTGEPRKICEAKFQRAENEIRKVMNCEQIINPMKLITDPQTPWNEAMLKCFAVLFNCDAIYLLSDWKDSRGARIEFETAKELGLKLFFEGNLK